MPSITATGVRHPTGAGETTERNDPPSTPPAWKQAIAARQKPVLRSSIWQIVNTIVPYFALGGLMIWSLTISYWLTFATAILAAGFLASIFMIFHELCARFFPAFAAREPTPGVLHRRPDLHTLWPVEAQAPSSPCDVR